MDNAPYHCRTRAKPPTTESSKSDIKEWLLNHNVSFSQRALRPKLLSISQEFIRNNGGREAYTVYELDAWADEEWGVQILRLPPYHCFWNPIEFLWAQLKQKIRNTGCREDQLPIVKERALQFLLEFIAADAKALFEKTRIDENEVRSMLLEKEMMVEVTELGALYETAEDGHLVDLEDNEGDFDAHSDDEIVGEVFEEHGMSDSEDDSMEY